MAKTRKKARRAKKKTAKQRKPLRKKTKRGQKRGAKLPRKQKGVVRGSGAAARRKIQRKLNKASHLSKAEAKEIEKRYALLGAALDRVEKLVANGTATTADQNVMLRTERAMLRVERELTAREPEPTPEPIDASDRTRFCETHLTVADGGPFEIEGREWQRDEFWAALDGFRLWPVDHESLCPECTARTGSIVSSVYHADDSRSAEHRKNGCHGLHAHVIWLVALQLKRQQGKTAGVAGYAISSLFRYTRESIAYIAGSEDQSETLFRDNFGKPVTQSELKRDAEVQRTRLIVARNNSEFALYPTSLAGTTGGTRTLVVVDEARDVPSFVFAAFVPTVYARNGWRCPTGLPGHSWSSGDLELFEDRDGTAVDPLQERYGEKCTVCSELLEPWSGRVAVMSSAQELDGTDADWFHELCETLEAEPQPDTHVFRTARIVNPKVSRQIVNRSEVVLSKARGLTDSISIEAGGVSRRKGEPFLTHSEIVAIEDSRLVNQNGGVKPAVGFLDTSDVGHLTSLVLFEEDSRKDEKLWHRIVQTYLEVWDPKEQPNGFIDDRIIEAALRELLPKFALLAFRIDDRRRPWAKDMLIRLRKDAPFRRILMGCDETGEKWARVERQLGWSKFDERALGRTIRIFKDAQLRSELKAARKFRDIDGRLDIREKSKRKRHLDIAEGVASCCLMVHEIVVTGGPGPGLADIERGGSGSRAIVTAMRRRRSRVPKVGRGDY